MAVPSRALTFGVHLDRDQSTRLSLRDVLVPMSSLCHKRSFSNVPHCLHSLACAGALASGVGCNQIGAGENTGHGANARTRITSDQDEEDVGDNLIVGICLNEPTKGFRSKLCDYVNEEGIIVGKLCEKPGFAEPGSTLGKTTWEQDGSGRLVLSNKRSGPTCVKRGTIPAERVVGTNGVVQWRVPDKFLEKVRGGQVVFRDQHNRTARAAATKISK